MDEIDIVAYDAGWPAAYEAERTAVQAALHAIEVVAIAHIGSTAVPGLAAKPVIDIAVTVRSVHAARERVVPALAAVGYQFWEDNPDPEHLFFVKGLPPRASRRTHHLHVVEPGPWFDDSVRFRDILRRDPTAARSYEALKRDLAQRHGSDREAYTEAKSTFVAVILSRY
ncbi:MAG TPA: GrpB family protein [Stellaceae bacterium]|nr:GrpB family protein [Stellaceae bacterium]